MKNLSHYLIRIFGFLTLILVVGIALSSFSFVFKVGSPLKKAEMKCKLSGSAESVDLGEYEGEVLVNGSRINSSTVKCSKIGQMDYHSEENFNLMFPVVWNGLVLTFIIYSLLLLSPAYGFFLASHNGQQLAFLGRIGEIHILWSTGVAASLNLIGFLLTRAGYLSSVSVISNALTYSLLIAVPLAGYLVEKRGKWLGDFKQDLMVLFIYLITIIYWLISIF